MKRKAGPAEWPPSHYRCPTCRGRLGSDQLGHEIDCAWHRIVRDGVEDAGARHAKYREEAAEVRRVARMEAEGNG
jgi:hypothetical protein